MISRMTVAGAFSLLLGGAIAAAQPISLSDDALASLVSRHFPGAQPAPNGNPRLPRFLQADFNGDARQDLVVLYTDSETAKRGEGCFGLGIVSDYLSPTEQRPSYQGYNCYLEYTVEVREYVPVKAGAAERRLEFPTPRSCVRLILKYGDRDFVCWRDRGYLSVYSTTRAQAPPDISSRRAVEPRRE